MEKSAEKLSGIISADLAKEYMQTWIKSPQNDLVNMFFTRYIGSQYRAIFLLFIF